MKFFICLSIVALFAVSALGQQDWSNEDFQRYTRSTYGGHDNYAHEGVAPAMKPGYATTHTYQSYAPTVPCAKNVLVSCSPSVAPVPCAAPSYGHGNSYSAPSYDHGSSYAAPSHSYGGHDSGYNMLGATHGETKDGGHAPTSTGGSDNKHQPPAKSYE